MPKPKPEKKYLINKRNEIIWALSSQGYRDVDIAMIFNINRSSIKPILFKIPKDYKPKWEKIQNQNTV